MATSRLRRRGLPAGKTPKRTSHYVDEIARKTGTSIGLKLDIQRVKPNPAQPRKSFDDLDDLQASITERGVLEPILVRPQAEDYLIVAGERRYRAACQAGLKEIPAIILDDATDADALEIALIENLQRKDLTPFEEARALRNLQANYNYTHQDIAKKLGKARTSITETLRLADLPTPIQAACEEAGISQRSILLEIAKQPTPEAMAEALKTHQTLGLKREDLRRQRKPKTKGRPPNFVYRHTLQNKARLELKFPKSKATRNDIIQALRAILEDLMKQ